MMKRIRVAVIPSAGPERCSVRCPQRNRLICAETARATAAFCHVERPVTSEAFGEGGSRDVSHYYVFGGQRSSHLDFVRRDKETLGMTKRQSPHPNYFSFRSRISPANCGFAF